MQAALEGMSECTSDIWSLLRPVDLVATSSCLIRTSEGFRSILPLKPLLQCSPSNPLFATEPRLEDHIMCCVCKFHTSHGFFSAFCWGHLFALWVISFCRERIYDVVAVQKNAGHSISARSRLSEKLSDWWDVASHNSLFNWH